MFCKMLHKKTESLKKIFGIYICPICHQRMKHIFVFSEDKLPILVSLSRNPIFNAQTLHCPDCHRRMWLSKVFNLEGKLVFDAHQFLNVEKSRFRPIS